MKPWLKFTLGLPAALLLALPVIESAAAAFTAGFYASPPRQDAPSVDVGIDGQGNALYTWVTDDPVTHDLIVQLRARTAAGVFAAPQNLSTTGHDAQPPHVAVNGNGDAVFVWQIRRGNVNTTTPVQGRARAANGALGPIFNVAPHPGGNFSFEFANPNVAIDAAGNATFTWTGRDAAQKLRAYARRRLAGGALGPVLVLSAQGGSNPVMAVSANGLSVFVWVRNDGAGHNLIEARQLTAGAVLRPIKIIGQGIQGSGGGGLATGNPQVGVDSQGNALIAWEQPDGQGPCGINGCPKILSRTLSNSGVVAVVPQTFSTTTSGGFLPQIAMDANGNAVVMWAHSGLEIRTRSAAGALGPLLKVTNSTGIIRPLLKGDPAGNIVAVWQLGTTIKARSRSSAGVFGPTSTFAVGGQPASGNVLAVGTGGKAVVAWNQPDGLGQCFGGSSCSRAGTAFGP